MHFLRKLLREIHRRSVWQVLGVYVVGSWVVLEGVRAVTDLARLPRWTPTFALILLLIGAPIVTATAIVQRGVPWLRGEYRDEVDPESLAGRTPDEVLVVPDLHPLHRERMFTWRNAILGGVCAAALLVSVVVAYLILRVTGLGPMSAVGVPKP